eukprot:s1266_g2.t1
MRIQRVGGKRHAKRQPLILCLLALFKRCQPWSKQCRRIGALPRESRQFAYSQPFSWPSCCSSYWASVQLVLAASLECHGVRFTCMHPAFVLNELQTCWVAGALTESSQCGVFLENTRNGLRRSRLKQSRPFSQQF